MKKTKEILCLALAMLMLLAGCTKKSSEKQILSFRFDLLGIETAIEEEAKTIFATLPSDADVTNLVPTIVISDKATVNPGSEVPMDFTNPVTYTVTAEDGSQSEYKVTILLEPKSDEKKILSFRFEGFEEEVVFDENMNTIETTLPHGTDVTNLVPLITVSEKATINPASGVPTDFSNPVVYTVTAEDGSQAFYTITVIIEELVISSQSFVGIWGVEKIEYYMSDHYGYEVYEYDPYDTDDGIQLVYWIDGTGEMRDGSIDAVWTDWNEDLGYYETMIICPDTIFVNPFTYSYNPNAFALYMNVEYQYPSHHQAFLLNIIEFTSDTFVYENEYASGYFEKAYLRRLSYIPEKTTGTTGKKSQFRPRKQGSLLSGK